MSDVLGNNLKLTVFGESHGPLIGASLSNFPAGFKIDYNFIKEQLKKRKADDIYSTQRQEDDDFKIVSGVYNGYTTGSTITLIIENKKFDSSAYQEKIIRPGHADYTSEIKYHGYQDYNGGGHFSGRITAPIVGICAIVLSYLKSKGIIIGSHIKEIHGIKDDEVTNILDSINKFNNTQFPTVSEEKKELMLLEIKKAKENEDSVGGIIETFVYDMPIGIGEPFFDSLESSISHAVFSIPGVKGIEFGLGFEFSSIYGSQANDEFYIEDNKVLTKTNNNAGINGGISNGMPIVIKTCLKPTPSIFKKQNTININSLENTQIEIKGRHDPCIVRRARVVIDSLVGFAILDSIFSNNN